MHHRLLAYLFELLPYISELRYIEVCYANGLRLGHLKCWRLTEDVTGGVNLRVNFLVTPGN